MSGIIRWLLLPPPQLLLLITTMSSSVRGDPSDSPPPYPPPPPAPFKPSVVVVVAILTTVFSITFLLLLYAKHCKRATNGYGGSPAPPSAIRKNSGVRRAVVESLPIFRFGSLRGPKDGLECAVCLSRFEPSEVLRLLPKCKHAFHVECVDTWLDAHSTCPLCRYRVDPEDILLVREHSNPLQHHQSLPPPTSTNDDELEVNHRTQRVSGRHSSAGELRGNNNNSNKLLQVILQQSSSSSTKRSLDSRTRLQPSSSSSSSHVPQNQTVVGCFDKHRKDGLLLEDQGSSFEKRFEHRITISSKDEQQQQQRWSDLQPSDLIYLRSEMIMNDSRRRYISARGSPNQAVAEPEGEQAVEAEDIGSGRIVINPRSASEIVGVSRRMRSENRRQRRSRHVAGVLSRWLAWVNVSSPSNQQRQPVDHSLPV